MFPNGLRASVCHWPFLLELGRISYCLYVIHQAVNLMCHEFLLGGIAVLHGRALHWSDDSRRGARLWPSKTLVDIFRAPAAPAKPRYQ
jgi:hypothetical protein